MSRKNSLENKRKRRLERAVRKSTPEERRATRFNIRDLGGGNLHRIPETMASVSVPVVTESDIAEAKLAEKGFIVAHQDDMLWKPGDED